MSPTSTNTDNQPEFPTHCPLCGAELNPEDVAAVAPTDDEMADTFDRGSVMFADACTNPDCPGRRGARARRGAEQRH